MKTYLLIIISLLTLGATAQVCPTKADYINPAVCPSVLGSGDTLVITRDYTMNRALVIQNKGVLILCGSSTFTTTGSLAVNPGGKVIITDCGLLRVGGSYSGDYTACEIESWCSDCKDASYDPLSVVGAKAWHSLCCQSSLPIELLSFKGYAVGEDNQIFWATGVEIDNDYFTVERSDNAVDWISIHEKDGTNSFVITHYSFTDASVQVRSYYRLKQTDYDGSFTYSPIILIDRSAGEFRELYRVNVHRQFVSKEYVGLVVIIYSDGSTKKVYQY